MTESDRKRALKEIELLEENNKKMEDEIKGLEATDNLDEENIKQINSLREKINDNNVALTNLRDLLKAEVDKQIDKFNNTSLKIETHLQRVKATFVLETNVEELNVSDMLTVLTEELKEFEVSANSLVEEMQQFKEMTGRDDFNLTPKEIKARVKTFKTRLRDLKREQIVKYNDRVEYINSVIKKHKETVKSDSEVYNMVMELEFLSECSATVGEWRHISYLSQINYAKMLETVGKIKEIEEKTKEHRTFDTLDEGLEHINRRIINLDMEIHEEMSYSTVVYANGMLEKIGGILLLSFGQRLERLKNQMTDEQYQKYSNKYNDLMQTYLAMEKRLRDIEKTINKENIVDYNNLSNELSELENEVNDFDFLVASLFGNVLSSAHTALNNKYIILENKVLMFENALEKEMQKMYDERLIDENQYENLKSRVNEIKKKLDNTNKNLKDPKMFSIEKTNDIYVFLNGTIEGLEKTLEGLEITLNHLEKPIKDREDRKHLDAIFKKMESEISMLEKQLEMYKDNDEEKYNATKERLDNVKKKMSGLGKNYRRKCPFLVKTVKSAKHFFKKYKKVLLVIAGLAAFAMLAHSVIIPAIMHGNLMLFSTMPALRGPIKTINNLLGGLVGATQDSLGYWYLANGVRLNASVAATSLLKGLAISGLGSAALVAPVIVAIKKLIEKINMAELKQKLIEGKDKVVEGTKKGVDAVKNGGTKVVESVKKGAKITKEKLVELTEKHKDKRASLLAQKEVREAIEDMVKDYSKSGLTVDEYCKQNNISGFLVEILNSYDQSVLEKKENMNRRKSGK